MGYSDMTGRPIREMTYEEKRQQRNLIIRQANDIGNIVKCLILGPVSAEGYEPWAQLLRKQIEAYRVGGSLRAMDGGADILETLDRLLASHERVIARMKEQTPT